MIPSYLITLREGIEAALIVGIILSYLKKVGAEKLSRPVYYGIAAGLLASVAMGVLFIAVSVEFEGRSEQLFEGATMLLAAAILTSMIFWMQRNSKGYSEDLKRRVQVALTRKETYGLAALAFVSIFREGIETVLFLGSASFSSTGVQILVGGSLGLLTALLLGLGIIRYSVKLDLKKFFNMTGLLLILFAAGLVAHGIHEFEEAGLTPPIVADVWNTNGFIDDHSDLGRLLTALFGYNGNPSLVEVLGYIGYWALIALWLYRDATLSVFRKAYAAIRPT